MEFSVVTELWDWLDQCWEVGVGRQNGGQPKDCDWGYGKACAAKKATELKGAREARALEPQYSFPDKAGVNFTLKFESRN